eukprot:scaffold21967_cov114-Isochrysis_galbana.AAC.2
MPGARRVKTDSLFHPSDQLLPQRSRLGHVQTGWRSVIGRRLYAGRVVDRLRHGPGQAQQLRISEARVGGHAPGTASPLVQQLRLRPVRKQQPHRVAMAGGRCHVERRFAPVVGRID